MAEGTEQNGPATPARAGRSRALWRAGLTAAVLVIAAAAVAFWMTRATPSRDPREFLPASCQAAVGVDMRLQSPGARQAARNWSRADLEQLRSRGVEIGQHVVSATGLDLDVRRDVLPWFGGEAVAAAVGWDDLPALHPDSLVLVARTTRPRRARASIEKGARPYVRDGDWRRFIVRRGEASITVWRDARGRDQLAYVLADGCLLLARHPEILELCLRAARPGGERLAALRPEGAVGKLPPDTIAWAYVTPSAIARNARFVTRGLQRGWFGALREYLSQGPAADRPGSLAGGGGIALGLAAAPAGADLRLVYDRPEGGASVAQGGSLRTLARFVPVGASAYLAVHRPDTLMTGVLPPGWGSVEPRQGTGGPLATMLPGLDPWALVGLTGPPTDLLVLAEPRPGQKMPAVTAVLPAAQVIVPPKGLLGETLKSHARVGEMMVLASDRKALGECLTAARQGGAPGAIPEGADLVLCLRRPRAAVVRELRAVVRRTPRGAEGEAGLVVPPRYLLGRGGV